MPLKTYSDASLMKMTKKELIDYIRMTEYNYRVMEDQLNTQYKYITEQCEQLCARTPMACKK